MQPCQGSSTPHRAIHHSAQRFRRGSVFGAPLTVLLALVLVGCGGGGGGGGSDPPAAPLKATDANGDGIRDSIEPTIQELFGSDPNRLNLARTLAVQAEALITSAKPTAEIARTALTTSSQAVQCASLQISQDSIEEVKLEVWRLTFDTPARRQRLKDVFEQSGAFILNVASESSPC